MSYGFFRRHQRTDGGLHPPFPSPCSIRRLSAPYPYSVIINFRKGSIRKMQAHLLLFGRWMLSHRLRCQSRRTTLAHLLPSPSEMTGFFVDFGAASTRRGWFLADFPALVRCSFGFCLSVCSTGQDVPEPRHSPSHDSAVGSGIRTNTVPEWLGVGREFPEN